MTEINDKNLFKTFIRYIIPSMAAQWVYTVYAIVDGIFVARGVSEKAFAAVNISYPYLCFLFSVSLGLAVGTSAVSSIYLGEGRKEEASERFTQSIVFSIFVGLFLTIFSLLFVRPISVFLGAADEETLNYICDYVGMIAPFSSAFLLSYLCEILMKADGYPEKSTFIVTFGCIFNIFLDYLLVIVFQMGTAGAAFATGFTQSVLTLIYISHFLRKKGFFHFTRFRFHVQDQLRIMRNGVSAAITESTPGVLTFIFNHFILMYLAQDRIVTYSICDVASCLIMLSCNGIAQGTQPLISYFHGAKQELLVQRLVKYMFYASAVFCVGSYVILFTARHLFVGFYIMDSSSELFRYTVAAFVVFELHLLLSWFNISLSGYYVSVERSFEAMLITFCRSFFMILLSLIFIIYFFGANQLWWSMAAGEGFTFLIACLILKKRGFIVKTSV